MASIMEEQLFNKQRRAEVEWWERADGHRNAVTPLTSARASTANYSNAGDVIGGNTMTVR